MLQHILLGLHVKFHRYHPQVLIYVSFSYFIISSLSSIDINIRIILIFHHFIVMIACTMKMLFRRYLLHQCFITILFLFLLLFKGIQAVRIEFFFILKVANIRCFILIAVEFFHNMRKQPRTKEIRRCFIFLNPVKNPMFTRAIFIRPESELIRESVCACAKLFVDEESTWHKSNRGRTNTLTDYIRKRHKKEGSASFV